MEWGCVQTQSWNVDNTWSRTLWRTEIAVSHWSIGFPPGDLDGGICRLWRASLKRWLPNLISMLLWSSVNLPNSRLCLLFGQIGWDWCCCCGFRLSAAVVGHYVVIQHQHAIETQTELLSPIGMLSLWVKVHSLLHLFLPTLPPLCRGYILAFLSLYYDYNSLERWTKHCPWLCFSCIQAQCAKVAIPPKAEIRCKYSLAARMLSEWSFIFRGTVPR